MGMRGRRHTAQEISAKLHQADQMAREGKLQLEIVQSLGVSVMTYHRWRKARQAQQATMATPRTGNGQDLSRLSELELQNSRLRRLAADILLEKLQLEDSLKVP